MNHQEARQEWVKALRSGEYRQCQSYLSVTEDDKTGYCCLGVACEVYNKLNPNNLLKKEVRDLFASENLNVKTQNGYISYYDNEGYSLPSKVCEWLGIHPDADLNDPYQLDEDNIYYDLVSANDNGLNFNQIANIIEQGRLESLS